MTLAPPFQKEDPLGEIAIYVEGRLFLQRNAGVKGVVGVTILELLSKLL